MSSEREVIAGPGVPPTIGPYSPGVRGGGFLYVSGQPGVDPETGQVAGDTPRAQARQAMRNVEAVLRAGGGGRELVVNGAVLVTGMGGFAADKEVLAEASRVVPPARMVMQVP